MWSGRIRDREVGKKMPMIKLKPELVQLNQANFDQSATESRRKGKVYWWSFWWCEFVLVLDLSFLHYKLSFGEFDRSIPLFFLLQLMLSIEREKRKNGRETKLMGDDVWIPWFTSYATSLLFLPWNIYSPWILAKISTSRKRVKS
jgi:hypothetical protein